VKMHGPAGVEDVEILTIRYPAVSG
jgi:hypothetical protein